MAVCIETAYRKFDYSFHEFLPVVIPVAVVLSYFIYRLITSLDQFMEIAIIMPFTSLTLRLLSSIILLKEIPTPKVILALVLMIGAQSIRLLWR